MYSSQQGATAAAAGSSSVGWDSGNGGSRRVVEKTERDRGKANIREEEI